MRTSLVAGLACAVLTITASAAEAQLGALISPGPLAKAHASLEGLTKCQSCHEPGRGVTAEKCLSCHRPVADRMAKGIGVHRNVRGECVTCHAEHAGVEGQLRPFDTRAFNHAAVTGFALDGKHSAVATDCAVCHKTRSFLTLGTNCASCHADVHKGTLGKNCVSCHSTKAAFKDLGGRFDHSKAAFPLTGAHRTVTCTACHVNGNFKGLKFALCSDCHRDPHHPAQSAPRVAAVRVQAQPFDSSCTACHTTDTWRTKKLDHNRQTAFPLLGRHAEVACAACHVQPATQVKPRSDTCAACHTDVHRGAFRQDCKACHNESGFQKAPFNHTQTMFPLTGKHEGLACSACHKNKTPTPTATAPARAGTTRTSRPAPAVDFRGLKTACASCHADVHQAQLGTMCETCHSTTRFDLPNYVHPRFAEFFAGQHAMVPCEKCHVPEPPTGPTRTGADVLRVKFRDVSTSCVSCHRDVHLGQEGTACEKCHSVNVAKFGLENFSHAATGFTLAARHAAIPCASCHKVETAAFPAGTGTAMRLHGVARECRACHNDVHLGQLGTSCESCHGSATFKLASYKHRNQASDFFVGRHLSAQCVACHKPFTGRFPSGVGTAVRFQVDRRCVTCHVDTHRGALGPNCINCHRP